MQIFYYNILLFSLLFNILLIAIILFSSLLLQCVRSYIISNIYLIFLFSNLLNKRLDFWNDVMHYCKIEDDLSIYHFGITFETLLRILFIYLA